MAGSDGIVVNEYQLRPGHCARTRPGTYFAISPAGGLGWSVGAALGARRAEVLRYADSGDVSGDKSSVVGYMAAAVC